MSCWEVGLGEGWLEKEELVAGDSNNWENVTVKLYMNIWV